MKAKMIEGSDSEPCSETDVQENETMSINLDQRISGDKQTTYTSCGCCSTLNSKVK